MLNKITALALFATLTLASLAEEVVVADKTEVVLKFDQAHLLERARSHAKLQGWGSEIIGCDRIYLFLDRGSKSCIAMELSMCAMTSKNDQTEAHHFSTYLWFDANGEVAIDSKPTAVGNKIIGPNPVSSR